MMSDDLEWIVINDGIAKKEIGAIGFHGSKVVVVVAFYDSLDANQDGKVSWGEWAAGKISPINLENRAVTEVAMAARYNMDVLRRDPSFNEMAANLFVQFAKGLIADGIYAVYFSRGVSSIAKPIAGRVTSNMVKQFVVRKGMEKTVKAAYGRSMR